jgi:ribosomal protein L11 methyltransferase
MVSWALHTDLDLDAVNLHLGELEEAGLQGIVEQDGRSTIYLPARVDGLALPGRWELVPRRDWNELWRRGLEPVTVGAFVIVPPWRAHDPLEGREEAGGRAEHGELNEIVIEPGQAFGTGHHETTAGCLAALQELELRGRRVLDVGTGTGVLAICAARLGAEVVAVDTDPLAVEAATANAARNAVAVTVLHGSVGVAAARRYDVVVANLDTATLSALAAELGSALTAGGTLVASGVSLERWAEAADALVAAGVEVRVRLGNQWAVLVGTAPPGHP